MVDKVLFSSKKDHWGTPRELFESLDQEFDFTLDPAGHAKYVLKPDMLTLVQRGTIKHEFTTRIGDGLLHEWKDERVFVNPPYTLHRISDWVKKCYMERNAAELIVLLIPARTDTLYFHDWIYNIAELRFIKGSLKFWDILNDCQRGSSTFPAMLAIYQRGSNG